MQYIILKIYNKLHISMLILLDMYDIIQSFVLSNIYS